MIGHAVGDSTSGHPPGTHMAVLMQPDEASLAKLAVWLEGRGLTVVRVFEDDEPYPGQLMALGIPLGRKGDLRRHLSSVPSLR